MKTTMQAIFTPAGRVAGFSLRRFSSSRISAEEPPSVWRSRGRPAL